MLASTWTASARDAPVNATGGAAAGTGHRSSRRANNSALIAEICSTATESCSPRASHPRTAATSASGTYRAMPRPAVFGVKYTYGPCGSPAAQRHPGLPHRRVCSTSDPSSVCSTSGNARASRARRASSARVDRPDKSALCVFITQDYAVAAHRDQQPRTARVTTDNSIRPSTESRCSAGGSARSVHDHGTVTCPPTPPEHTNTGAPARRLTNKTSRRCPLSG